MPKGILERLSEGVVLGDGGYLLSEEREWRARGDKPMSGYELHRSENG